jgi:Anti-sigma-K factor rskA, C-terminal/Putative zinc-finger
MDHRAFRELAAGAALDDLDPAERASLDDHLAACSDCRDEARELVDVAGLLTFAVPQRRPPASLRGGVLAAIAASEGRPVGVPAAALAYAGAAPIAAPALAAPALAAPATPSLPLAPTGAADVIEIDVLRRERARYRRLSFAGLAAAAALAIAVGALGTTAAGLNGRLEETAAERDAAVAQLARTDEAMTVVLAPDHATAVLTPEPMAAQANVYVVYRPGTTEAWLMAENLPPTPPGSVYQLWSADAAGVHGLTTFTCEASQACLAPFGVDLGDAKATMITLEPAGGAVGEPGPQVAFGELEG